MKLPLFYALLIRSLLLAVLAMQHHVRAEAPAYSPSVPTLEVAITRLDWRDAKRDREVPAKIYFPKDGASPFEQKVRRAQAK